MNEHHERLMLVVGMYTNQAHAQQLVEKLIQEDFPMDRISLLSRAGGAGDDMLGVTYHDTGDRMKAWGKHGAFWGAIWGLLAGASGMFVLPGLGTLLVAGPIVEALGAAIAGAAVAGGTMAGAAAVSHLASALHRIGIPEDELEQIESAIQAGQYVVILHCAPEESEKQARTLAWTGADPVYQLPVKY
jgi:hypothetical protein